jgi:hypothetical protein
MNPTRIAALARRVARRHTAGLIKPPPAMVEAIYKWAAACLALSEMERREQYRQEREQDAASGGYDRQAALRELEGLIAQVRKTPTKWKVYSEQSAKYNSEVGRIEGIRCIESNNTNALSGSLGSGSVLGEAVVFGDDPVVMASVHDPELRAKESEDYGRSKGVAWYGIYGFDQIWKDSATAGEARVIHVTSA